MKKIFLIITMLIYIPLVNADEFDVTAKHVILYNMEDGFVLYEKNAEEPTSIASLTKIMTAIVAIENNDDLNEIVDIKYEMLTGLTGYTIVGLKPSDNVTIKDLLYGALLPSGADAVHALAYHTSGSIEGFVKLMNNKATELGLKNTHFQNPVGIDHEDNYSTASDMAKLLQYCLENPIFKEIFTTRKYEIESMNLEIKTTLYMYANPYGLDISNITGAKSGFTQNAGYCLASIATLNDVDYLLINLGSDKSSKGNAIKDTLEVYNYYSSNYGYKLVLKKDVVLKSVPIKNGKEENYNILSKEDLKLYLKNDVNIDKITYEYDGIDVINKDVLKGDKLGKITLKYGDNDLTSFDVYLTDVIEYKNSLVIPIMIVIAAGGVIVVLKRKH